MKLTTLLCYFLLLTTITQAQKNDKYGRPALVPGIAELHIGDQVPDILIDKIINNDKRSIRTSDYKDKLLVLDFWDTTCATCIASMPKLDSLQAVFGDRIKLLSVTWMPEDKIVNFFKTNRFLKEHNPPVNRPSVVGDRTLRSYFPYETNPHVVWIYKGKVIAITGGEYITGEGIETILHGKNISWPLKNDAFDPMNPILSLTGLSGEVSDSNSYGYSVLTGLSNDMNIGLGGLFYRQDTIRNVSRVAFFNQDLSSAYKILLFATKQVVTKEDLEKDATKAPYLPNPYRIAIECSDLSRFRNDHGEDQALWNRKNRFCYEIERQGLVDQMVLAKAAVIDLNNRLELNARYEMRKVKCLVFIKTDKPLADTLSQGRGGMSIPVLAMMRLDMTQKFPPAINETGLGFEVEFNILSDDGTLSGLRKEIQRHGLDMIEAEREIEVLVISDAKVN